MSSRGCGCGVWLVDVALGWERGVDVLEDEMEVDGRLTLPQACGKWFILGS